MAAALREAGVTALELLAVLGSLRLQHDSSNPSGGGGLLGGRTSPEDVSELIPKAQALLIVPDVGERSAVLFSGMRLLTRQEAGKVRSNECWS